MLSQLALLITSLIDILNQVKSPVILTREVQFLYCKFSPHFCARGSTLNSFDLSKVLSKPILSYLIPSKHTTQEGVKLFIHKQ